MCHLSRASGEGLHLLLYNWLATGLASVNLHLLEGFLVLRSYMLAVEGLSCLYAAL